MEMLVKKTTKNKVKNLVQLTEGQNRLFNRIVSIINSNNNLLQHPTGIKLKYRMRKNNVQ